MMRMYVQCGINCLNMSQNVDVRAARIVFKGKPPISLAVKQPSSAVSLQNVLLLLHACTKVGWYKTNIFLYSLWKNTVGKSVKQVINLEWPKLKMYFLCNLSLSMQNMSHEQTVHYILTHYW